MSPMLQLQCYRAKWAELQVGGGGKEGPTRRIIRGWERTYGFRRISTAALISQPPKYLTCPQHQILRERKLDGKGGEAKRTPLESGKSFKISKLTCSHGGLAGLGGTWLHSGRCVDRCADCKVEINDHGWSWISSTAIVNSDRQQVHRWNCWKFD